MAMLPMRCLLGWEGRGVHKPSGETSLSDTPSESVDAIVCEPTIKQSINVATWCTRDIAKE